MMRGPLEGMENRERLCAGITRRRVKVEKASTPNSSREVVKEGQRLLVSPKWSKPPRGRLKFPRISPT
jgi:hypothetical protein